MSMKQRVDDHNTKPRFYLERRTIFARAEATLTDDGKMSFGLDIPVCDVPEYIKHPEDILKIMNDGVKNDK